MGSYLSLLGWTTTADIQALQKMIDHVNHSVETDFEDVMKLSEAVKSSRAQLDQAMMNYRDQMSPACKDFTGTHDLLFKGAGGQPPLAETCLEAQGHMKTMLNLDFPISGCDNVCDASVWSDPKAMHTRDVSLMCNHGPCQSTLRCVRQLEGELIDQESMRRKREVWHSCTNQGFDLWVAPPIGMEAAPGPDEDPGSLCGKVAHASMLSPEAAVLMCSQMTASSGLRQSLEKEKGQDCDKGVVTPSRINAHTSVGRQYGSQAGHSFL